MKRFRSSDFCHLDRSWYLNKSLLTLLPWTTSNPPKCTHNNLKSSYPTSATAVGLPVTYRGACSTRQAETISTCSLEWAQVHPQSANKIFHRVWHYKINMNAAYKTWTSQFDPKIKDFRMMKIIATFYPISLFCSLLLPQTRHNFSEVSMSMGYFLWIHIIDLIISDQIFHNISPT